MRWQNFGFKICVFASCLHLVSLLADKVAVEEFNDNYFTTYPDWTFSIEVKDPITTCGNFGRIFGGYKKFGQSLVLTKKYQWANTHHYAVVVSFSFFKIDTWDGEKVLIYVDDKNIGDVSSSLSDGKNEACGQSFNDLEYKKSFTISPHEAASLELKFVSQLDEDTSNESWGINNIKISLKECDSTCRTCKMSGTDKCTSCYTNALLQSGKCACRNYYFHKDQYPASNCLAEPCGMCERCDLTCKTCSGPTKDDCLSCESGDVFSSKLLTCAYPQNSQVIAAELTGKAFTDSALAKWDIIPNLDISQRKSTCGAYVLVGGLNKFQGGTVVRRSFASLPPHFSARLKIMVLKIDKWEGNKFFISVDGSIIKEDTFQSNDDYVYTSNQCGSSSSNEAERVYLITFPHTASEMAFELKTDLNEVYSNGFWGFANFELVVYKCLDGCGACSEKQDNCLSCQENFFLTQTNSCLQSCPAPSAGDLASRTCVPSCLNPNEYIDQSDRICKTCGSLCKTCVTKSDFCSSCELPRFLQNNNCLAKCLDQFFADTSDATCKPCSSPCYTCAGDSKSCLSCCENYYLLDKNCLTSCPDSYFQDGTDRQCKKCSPPCFTCDFPGTSCLSCSEPNFLSSTSCLVNCPPGFWENVSDRKCKPCTSPCATCSGAGNSCLSCSENYYLLDNTCVTSCPDGYFLDGTNKACKKCSSPCLTCEFPGSASSCLSCSEPNFLAGNSCLINCPSGFWEAMSVRKCKPCSSPCKSCLASPDRCLNCVESFYLDSEACLTLCPLGKWGDKSDYLCKDCASPCKSCLHENGASCLSCISSYFLSGLLCTKTCPEGFYADKSTGKCSACNDQCKTCLDQEDFCTSCAIPRFFYQNKCLDKCSDHYFEDINVRACKPCSVPCLACVGDSVSCLSCTDSYFLLGSSCVQSCPNNHYLDLQAKACKICLSPCTTCQSPGSSCLSCSQPHFLSETSCLTTCPSGFWADLKDRKCLPCLDPCKTCSNAANLCLSCAPSLFLESETCLDRCPSGKWGDRADNTCKGCYFPCKTCAQGDGSKCLSCQSSFFLFEERCTQNCPAGTFAHESSEKCLQCNSECKTCVKEAGTCLTCSPSFFLNSQKCTSTCPAGTYAETLQLKCEACQEPCSKCIDNAAKCSACTAPLYLNGQICQKECPAGYFGLENEDRACTKCSKSCLTCIKTESFCSSCSEPFFLNNGACDLSCSLESLWADPSDRRCKSLVCIYPCETCLGNPKSCKSCTSSYFLLENNCLSACPAGMWGDVSDRLCKLCEASCATCLESANFCLSCKAGYFLSGSACVSKCPEGQWTDSDLCRACNKSCRTCENSKTCTSCLKPFFLLKEECLLECPRETFADEPTRSCRDCKPDCRACVTLKKCLSCPAAKFLRGSDCVQDCSPGEYGDGSDFICKPCSSLCKTCSQESSSCLACHKLTYLLNKTCVERCPEGMWADAADNQCKHCLSPCKTCSESDRLCTSCAAPMFLSEFSCLSDCPSGFFGDKTDRICKNCITICLSCIDHADKCTSCGSPYFLKGETCLEDCGQGNWGDSADRACKKCSSNCPTCIGSSASCSSCVLGEFLKENKCNKCNPGCLECSRTPEHCSKCLEGYYHFQPDQICLEACPIGYWNDASQRLCKECNPDCLSCKETQVCTSCLRPKLLLVNLCVEFCPIVGFWEDSKESVCRAVCDPPNFFDGKAKECRSPCPDNFFGEERNRTCISDCALLNRSVFADEKRVCRPCKRGCLSCEEVYDFCFTCESGYYFMEAEHKCVEDCPENYCIKETKCLKCIKEKSRVSFNMALDNLVSEFKMLKILSNKPFTLAKNLQLEDIFRVRIEYLSPSDFSYSVKNVSRQEVVIIIDVKLSAKVKLTFEMNNLDDVIDESGMRLENFNDKTVLKEKRLEIVINMPVLFVIDSGIMSKIEKVEKSVEISVPASFASSSLPAIFFQNFNFMWSLIDCIQISSFFLLINIDYPPNAKLFLQKLLVSHLELIPDFLKDIFDIKTRNDLGETNDHIVWYQRAPYRFHKLNYTVNLIDNAGVQIQYLIMLYTVLFFIRAGVRFTGKNSKLKKLFTAVERLYCYTLFILLHNMIYLKICLSSMLQLTNYSQKQPILLICYFASCFLIVYLLLFKAWLFKNIHHPDFWLGVAKHTTRYDILVCDVNFDSFWSKNLFFFTLLQKFFICVILVCFQMFPLVQISLLAALEFLMFLFFVFTKPFVSQPLNVIKAINSFLFTLLYLIALAFYLIYVNQFETALGRIDKDFENYYFTLGWIFNSFILFCMLTLLIFYFYQLKLVIDEKKEEIKLFLHNIFKRGHRSKNDSSLNSHSLQIELKSSTLNFSKAKGV